MSYCPTPAAAKQRTFSNGTITSTPKQAKYEICEGGTTTQVSGPGTNVTNTVCCPNPGPAGERGCALRWESIWLDSNQYYFEGGDPCVTSIVSHNNVVYICKQSHDASDTLTTPGDGTNWTQYWDIFMAAGSDADHLSWAGTWADGNTYTKNNVIIAPSNGHTFVCIQDHVADSGNIFAKEPKPTGTSLYWEKMVDFDKAAENNSTIGSIIDGVMDWWDDANLWERALGIAAGIGLVYAGSRIVDAMSNSGDGDGSTSADSRYTGTPGYNGAFNAPMLDDVVSSIMTYAGYDVSEFDVSQLPNKPVHFSINGSLNCRDLLKQLATTYQFDVIPSGGIVKFVPKVKLPIRDLTLEDMGHRVLSDSYSGTAPYTAKRFQGIDLPRAVTFNYYSATLDHNVFTQHAEIHTFEDGQDVTISVPFTMDDTEAMRVAQSVLVNAHIEQQEFVFTTDYHNIDLEPGDVITIPVGNITTQVRIKEINERDDGVLELRTSRCDYNDSSYDFSDIPVVHPPYQDSNIPVTIGFSDTLFFEAPPVDSDDTTPRIMGVVTGFGKAGWPGATVFNSIDGGATYVATGQSRGSCTWGIVDNPTPAPTNGYYTWDNETSIIVYLKEGTLDNVDELGVLNGNNWAMLGQELIGFKTATLVDANLYAISGLLRGRRGSEVHCGTHAASELFVLLDGTPLEFDIPTSELKKINRFKTVTHGSSLDKADAFDVQAVGVNMLPWKPAKASVVLTNGEFVMTWIERPRFNNSLIDDRELTHDADWAGFGITIFASDGTTVKRSAIVTTPTFTYTAAMQQQDFGSAQTTLNASVVQLSSIVGAGYAAQLIV